MCSCDCTKQIAQIQDQMNELSAAAAPFMSGHPIIPIANTDDISLFDTNGNGTGIWTGWAYCDGAVHSGFLTVDLRDKFIVGAGLSYNVGDTGGSNTVTLTTAEIPVHTHVITDPGHTHTASQAAHTHLVTDPGHTHAASQVAHFHNGTTSSDGLHTHATASGGDIMSSTNGGDFVDNSGSSQITVNDSLVGSGVHSHTITTDSQTPAVNVTSAFTGVSLANATPVITVASNTTGVTAEDEGGDGAHENRPPYYALIFVQKC